MAFEVISKHLTFSNIHAGKFLEMLYVLNFQMFTRLVPSVKITVVFSNLIVF